MTKTHGLRARLGQLKAARVNFDTTWDRIARLILPTAVGFTTTYAPGTDLNRDIFDATGQLALPRFAAAIDTLITPQDSRWHQMTVPKEQAGPGASDREVVGYLEYLTDTLFAARYRPAAGFSTAAFEAYMSTGAFGNGVIYVHDAKPGIQYMSVHLAEVWFDVSATGVVDTAFWVHEYTLRQVEQRWPGKLPPDLAKELATRADRKVKVCTAVYPRTERDPRNRSARNMPFACCVFIADGRDDAAADVLEESGYRTFPFAVARYVTAPREVYARGPAHDALADLKMLNEMAKTMLRFGQLMVDPVYLTSDADDLDPFDMRPGAIAHGYLDHEGRPRIQPMRPQGDPGFSLELINERRQAVNQAFLVNLFQVLVDKPASDRKTATEVLALTREKGALLGPIVGRLRDGFLAAIIDRELDILAHARVFDLEDAPASLRATGGQMKVEYDSPLSRAMMAEQGLGIYRTLEAASQLAQFDPSIPRTVNAPRVLERLAAINGAPVDILFSAAEMAQREEADAQQQQLAQAAQVAPPLADAAKTLAETDQMVQQPGII